jgi:hypothetical protein
MNGYFVQGHVLIAPKQSHEAQCKALDGHSLLLVCAREARQVGHLTPYGLDPVTRSSSLIGSRCSVVPEIRTTERVDAFGDSAVPFCQFSDASIHFDMAYIPACTYLEGEIDARRREAQAVEAFTPNSLSRNETMTRVKVLSLSFFDAPFVPAISLWPMKLRAQSKLGYARRSFRARITMGRMREGMKSTSALQHTSFETSGAFWIVKVRRIVDKGTLLTCRRSF